MWNRSLLHFVHLDFIIVDLTSNQSSQLCIGYQMKAAGEKIASNFELLASALQNYAFDCVFSLCFHWPAAKAIGHSHQPAHQRSSLHCFARLPEKSKAKAHHRCTRSLLCNQPNLRSMLAKIS